MKAIVIATTKDRSDWATECFDSLKDYKRYPVIILDSYEYELGKLRFIRDYLDLDEFILLQDSVILKDTDWLDGVFDYDGSVSFAKQSFFMYLGKYQMETLKSIEIPHITTKKQAVEYETSWASIYAKEAKNLKSIFELEDTNVFAEHLGRNNMIIENDHLIKYKHIWNGQMIYDY